MLIYNPLGFCFTRFILSTEAYLEEASSFAVMNEIFEMKRFKALI